MKAVITGVTGFVGTHLAEYLLEQGDRVLGITRAGRWTEDAPEGLARQVPLAGWDLARPAPGALAARLRDFAPDVLYHLAAISVPAECGRAAPTDAARRVNVEGTRHLVELLAGWPSPPRLLFASSCYVYAPVSPEAARVSESAPLGPSAGYGMTKLAAEQLVAGAARRGAIAAVIARSFQHTGPRQSDRMIIPDWARQLTGNSREPLRVICRDTYLDLTDVRDIVRAYRNLMLASKTQGIYNVGSGRCYRSGDLLDDLKRLADPDRAVVELAPGRRQHPIADITRITKEIGWQPLVPLQNTLRDTLDYWRQKAGTA